MGTFELFVSAIGLVLIIEGILPFLSPDLVRWYSAQVQSMDNRSLRMGGLASMLIGLGVLYLFGG